MPQYAASGPSSYSYNYGVEDGYAGVSYSAHENRDGYATDGGYEVLLPDGRVQRVTYKVADGESGFVADVTYSKPQYS